MSVSPETESPLAALGVTRSILASHGLETKHALGQNFLINDAIIKKIIKLSDVGANDCVLEVGPGIGTLTVALLKHAGSVISVERDKDLPSVLAQTCATWADSFTLLNKDALDLQISDFDGREPTCFVANLPYAVAAALILDYFERFQGIASATIMVQKEVADRIMAQPGSKDYGAYTVKLGMYAKPAGRFAVSAGNFYPPPRVESAVVRLDRTTPHDGEGNELSPQLVWLTCRMADAAFATRRKTIANSFKTYLAGVGASAGAQGASAGAQGVGADAGASGAGTCTTAKIARLAGRTSELFERADIDPKRRGETLSHEEFITLGMAAAAMLAE